jgi:hypothetical protein
MFGALGALSGSKNPMINPAMLFHKDKGQAPPMSDIQSRQALGTSSQPRYGRGATSLSI